MEPPPRASISSLRTPSASSSTARCRVVGDESFGVQVQVSSPSRDHAHRPGRRRWVGSPKHTRFVAVGQGADLRETRAEGAQRRRGVAIGVSPRGFVWEVRTSRLDLFAHVVEHRPDPAQATLRQARLVRHRLVPEVGAYRALTTARSPRGTRACARAAADAAWDTRAGLSCASRVGERAASGAGEYNPRPSRRAAVCQDTSRGFFLLRGVHRHNSSAAPLHARGG